MMLGTIAEAHPCQKDFNAVVLIRVDASNQILDLDAHVQALVGDVVALPIGMGGARSDQERNEGPSLRRTRLYIWKRPDKSCRMISTMRKISIFVAFEAESIRTRPYRSMRRLQ